MANFEFLSGNLNNVLLELIDSQELCKLLHYPSYDPLSEPDIKDTSELLFDKIHPYPRVPEVTATTTSNLNVIFDSFALGDASSIKEGLLKFTILVHNELWRTEGALRPFLIMSKIDNIFNDKRIIGLKKLQFERANFIWANEKFSGYQVSYRMVNAN
ncbi:hypothetical protein [Brevibacillus sp. NRS-1366]|uniref:hypothetical protein n=1 Tax=Brevibacillus sp. NRS-1366 TaxID=3233899 RepID=UPI003D24EB66